MYTRFWQLLVSGIIVLLTAGASFAQRPDTLWTRTHGGGGSDIGRSVQQTTDGGYIITGSEGSFPVGDRSDIYLVKTDANGDTLWTRNYGGDLTDRGYSVQQTTDGGYIVAGMINGFFGAYLLKTDANGDTLWTRRYAGGHNSEARSVEQTSDSGYVFAGFVAFVSGYDVYLVKTDASGDTLWTRTYGDSLDQIGGSVRQTSDGGYIIVGYSERSLVPGNRDVYLVKTNANGDTLWTQTYSDSGRAQGYSVQQTSDGGYIIVGTTWIDPGSSYVYLIKTDANGDTLWARRYGEGDDHRGRSVQQTSDGGYIIAGTIYFDPGSSYVYLIKTDANGDTLWTGIYGGNYNDDGYSVRQTSDNGYIIAGNTSSFGAGDHDVYLIKIGPDLSRIDELDVLNGASIGLKSTPNPCNAGVMIEYTLPSSRNTQIVIYNLCGQEVRTLVNRKGNAGTHRIVWDGRDYQGYPVSPGIYFIRLQAGDQVATRKIVLVR